MRRFQPDGTYRIRESAAAYGGWRRLAARRRGSAVAQQLTGGGCMLGAACGSTQLALLVGFDSDRVSSRTRAVAPGGVLWELQWSAYCIPAG